MAKCKYCGSTSVFWDIVSSETGDSKLRLGDFKWRLRNTKDGTLHNCRYDKLVEKLKNTLENVNRFNQLPTKQQIDYNVTTQLGNIIETPAIPKTEISKIKTIDIEYKRVIELD